MINSKKIYIIGLIIILLIIILYMVKQYITSYNSSRLNKYPYSLYVIEESINLNSSRSNIF